MNIITAEAAAHKANQFWWNNREREYDDRIMFAINNLAEGGRRKLEWLFFLPPKTFNWLCTLGYTVQEIEWNHAQKRYKYSIMW